MSIFIKIVIIVNLFINIKNINQLFFIIYLNHTISK